MGLRTFTFGGTSSSTYNMFITEAATYNVPERAVEMLEIPGRNGHFAMDLGRFENVEVTYHVVVHKDTNANFQTELSNVRNWLASKKGYQRLTDDYNSNVYRMAIFKDGIETDETFTTGAEFDITFECKPQRWLTSGETATTVANNGTMSNPTLFDSEPLLAVKGYGDISFNGYTVTIENAPLGVIPLIEKTETKYTYTPFTFDDTLVNNNDPIIVNWSSTNEFYGTFASGDISIYLDSYSDSNSNFKTKATDSLVKGTLDTRRYGSTTTNATVTFTAGTDGTATNSAVLNYETFSGKTLKFTFSQTITYTASTATISFSESFNITHTGAISGAVIFSSTSPMRSIEVFADSTVSALGNPTYIDCDIGECYLIKNDEIISLNGVISLGSDLPKLAPGTNTFTMDNTITELKVTPRWWRV